MMWLSITGFFLAHLTISAAYVAVCAFPKEDIVLRWVMNPVPPATMLVQVIHPSGDVLFTAKGTNVIPAGSTVAKRVNKTIDTNTTVGHIEFTLTSIIPKDAGHYKAAYGMGGSLGETQIGIYLLVYGQPDTPKITLKSPPVVGRDMNLECITKSNTMPSNHNLKMTYIWYENGKFLRNENGSQLLITNIKREDNDKVFTCKAYEKRPLISMDSAGLTIIVQYGPGTVLPETAKQQTLQENNGTLGPFKCSADCYPPCSYQWQLNDKDLSSESDTLEIGNIDRNSAGIFRCNAANLHGSKFSESITVTVEYAPDTPDLTITGGNVNIKESLAISLKCTTQSVPTSKITIHGANGTSLSIQQDTLANTLHVHANCLDTGTFYCSAENSLGESTSSGLQLNVLCKPRLDNRVSQNRKQALGSDENMNISAALISNPLPNIHWSMPRNWSSMSDRLKNNTDGFVFYDYKEVLTITSRLIGTNMEKDKFGEFMLHAQNEYGNSTITFLVTPRRRPDAPELLTVLCKLKIPVEIAFAPNFNGGDTQIFSIGIKSGSDDVFETVGENLPDNNKKEMTLKGPNLKSDVLYFFSITSSNSFGTTLSTNQLNCTIEKKELSNLTVIAAAAAGSIVFVIIVIVVLAILMIKRKNKEKNDDTERMHDKPLNTDQDDAEDGMKPNILYESAGPRYKPQNGKIDNEQEETLVNDVYAEVVKPKNKKVNNDVYAEVVKPKVKGKKSLQNENISQSGAPNNKDGDVYENALKTAATKEQPSRKTNDEGLVYIDVEIKGTNTNQTKAVIHGIENKNEYADVVFTTGAAPLPPDNEGDNASEEKSV